MVAIRRFEDIEAWQRARELVRELYRVSSKGDSVGILGCEIKFVGPESP